MSSDLQQGIMQEGIRQHVATYQREAPSDTTTARAFQGAVDAFFQEINNYDEAAAAVRRDERLTDVGRREHLEPIRADFERNLAQRAEAVTRALKSVEARTAYTLPQLDPDPAVAEVRLGNARSDARMMLDVAGDQAPSVMKELVEANTDPAVTHLLMHTTWPALYLKSRGIHPALWEALKDSLMPRLLPEADAQKYRDAAASKHLRKASEIVAGAHHFALVDRGFNPPRKP